MPWPGTPDTAVLLANIAPDFTRFLRRRPSTNEIAYYRFGEGKFRCWLMSASGQQHQAISECHGEFSWSPDGRKLVLERSDDIKIDLWLFALDTNRYEKLLPETESVSRIR